MAGHSKWANIKHQKARSDAKKGKIFSRIAKEIIVAVKCGGGDPKINTRLRIALQKARLANMPSENIERNIKKASSVDQQDYADVTYEIYGHGGVGIVVEGMTDNRNRMASEMRIATNKRGGTIANPGAVVFNFDRKGVIQISKDQGSEESLFMIVTEAGAEDFEALDDMYVVTTDSTDLYAVKDTIESHGVICADASLEMIPKTTVDCDDEMRKANEALIEWLEELEDVDSVFHNMSE